MDGAQVEFVHVLPYRTASASELTCLDTQDVGCLAPVKDDNCKARAHVCGAGNSISFPIWASGNNIGKSSGAAPEATSRNPSHRTAASWRSGGHFGRLDNELGFLETSVETGAVSRILQGFASFCERGRWCPVGCFRGCLLSPS